MTESTVPAPATAVEEKDDDMTMEERVNWLKSRGIQIETSEDRKAAAAATKHDGEGECDTIRYVHIPHEPKALSERTVHRSKSKRHTAGDLLLTHLKPAFHSSDDTTDLSLLKSSPLVGSSAGPSTVSPSTLQSVAEQEGHVEQFRLVNAVPSNKFTGVNLYIDEIGLLKRLPLNQRAMELAQRCGYDPPPLLYGDVFVGRVQYQPTIGNVDVRVEEVKDGGEWVERAAVQNLEYQAGTMGVSDERQAVVDGMDGTEQEAEGYSWTQTNDEIEIRVKIPATPKPTVTFRPMTLRVSVGCDVKVALELYARVDMDGCTWTLETNKDKQNEKVLVITCEKSECVTWPRIVT